MLSKQAVKIWMSFGMIVATLMLVTTGLTAQGPTDPTRVRPTVDPGGGSGVASVSIEGGAVSGDNCAALYGTAIHWGVGGLKNASLRLSNGGWSAQSVSSDDGSYNMGGLGVGAGILIAEPPFEGVKPMINQAAVRLTCGFPVQANIGFYGGDERPTPPAQLTMRASTQQLSPGETTKITLKVNNTLPNPISQVVITDLFPDGLKIKNVQASSGSVEILDEQLLAVMVDSVPEGDGLEVVIIAQAGNEVADGTRLINTATLFYAESVADQTSLTLQVQSGSAIAQSTDNTATVAASDATPPAQAPDPEAEASADTPETAPDVLPTTGLSGLGLALSFPLGLFLIIGLLFKGVWSIRRRPE
jgi:uncharacterized repeat protein (TIGR01451 family)